MASGPESLRRRAKRLNRQAGSTITREYFTSSAIGQGNDAIDVGVALPRVKVTETNPQGQVVSSMEMSDQSRMTMDLFNQWGDLYLAKANGITKERIKVWLADHPTPRHLT